MVWLEGLNHSLRPAKPFIRLISTHGKVRARTQLVQQSAGAADGTDMLCSLGKYVLFGFAKRKIDFKHPVMK